MWRGFSRPFGGATSLRPRVGPAIYAKLGIYSASIPNHWLYVQAVVPIDRLRTHCKVTLRSEAAETSYSPGELETSVAAATAWRRRGCSGSPSELFAPATAGAAQLASQLEAPAERSRRAERSRKDCERRARRRAERPSFWSVRRS